MNCSSCDFSNPAGFRFCGGCGSPLTEAAPVAERRQLTVMFFDLVGSTTLSSQLDPEELRDLVQRYQEVCNGVVARHGGHVAQYLGDGILVYFGYPVSHEDDGRRALMSALDILEAMEQLNRSLPHRLDLRVGIHTGLTVVGSIGSRERRENLALGETPNIAARLQGVADVNQVVCSAATLHLALDDFETEDTGLHDLKGVPEPMRVYRLVRALSAAEKRARQRRRRAELPLVGRERELEWLRSAWRALPQGSVLGLVGEAGVGKSRLLEEWKDEVLAAEPALITLYGDPAESGTPFAGVAHVLRRELSLRSAGEWPLTALASELGREPAEAVPVMVRLLGLPGSADEGWAAPSLSPSAWRAACFALMNALVLKLAGRNGGLLICVDGFDWIDPSSAEWLAGLTRVLAEQPAVMVLAGRDSVPAPASLRVAPLQADAAGRLVALCGTRALPADEVVRRGEGIPLFLIELARWEDSGHVPGGLHDFFMARVDGLGEARSVAQQASVVGRQFAPALLRELAGRPVDEDLERLLEHSVVSGALHTEELRFVHSLLRDACYESLLKSVRQELHGRLAEVLGEQPVLAAPHWLLSAHPERALAPLAQAARRCFAVGALSEAGRFVSAALELVAGLPAGASRDRLEAQFLSLQGSVCIARHGYAAPQTEKCFGRAAELCAQGEPDFPVLAGLWALRLTQGRLAEAEVLSARLLELGHDEETSLVSRSARGQTLFFLGELQAAVPLLERAAAGYDPEQAGRSLAYFLTDPSIASLSYLSLCSTLLGNGEAARSQAALAMTRAEELGHAHTLAHTLAFDCWGHHCRNDIAVLSAQAERLRALSASEGFALWLGMAQVFEGCALLEQGEPRGVEMLVAGLQGSQATGTMLGATWMLSQLAFVQPDQAASLATVDQALALAEGSGERWFLPGLLQLKAGLLPADEAAPLLVRARELAERSGARFFLQG